MSLMLWVEYCCNCVYSSRNHNALYQQKLSKATRGAFTDFFLDFRGVNMSPYTLCHTTSNEAHCASGDTSPYGLHGTLFIPYLEVSCFGATFIMHFSRFIIIYSFNISSFIKKFTEKIL